MEIKINAIIRGAVNKLLIDTKLMPIDKRLAVENRLNICNSCDKIYLDTVVNKLRCGECKCFIGFKTANLNKKCPLNKWN